MKVNGCNSYGTASYKGIEFELEDIGYSGGFRVLTKTARHNRPKKNEIISYSRFFI